MERLTHERNTGIKTGYWSPATKEVLVQRLAAYENTGLEPEEIMDGKLLTGWILTPDKLPPEPEDMNDFDSFEEYIVTIVGAEKSTIMSYAGEGVWWDGGAFYNVIAWQPMPEVYKK